MALQEVRSTPPSPRSSPPSSAPSGELQVVRFLRDTIEELRKVVWPTPAELYRYTLVVIVTVVVISLFIGMVDFGLAAFTRKFIYNGIAK